MIENDFQSCYDLFENRKNKPKISLNTNIVRAGDFEIDLDIISKASIINMRRLLPREDYKRIKNRKCSRLTRLSRKTRTLNTQSECKRLHAIN